MERKEIKEIWEKFKIDIIYNNRYFSGTQIMWILNKLKHNGDKKEEKICKYYRSRIGSYARYDDHTMYAPPSKLTVSGRCNPVGIPYLYLSNSKETAINETKPSVGDTITVATFEVDVSNIFSFIDNESYMNNESLDEDVKILMEFISEDLRKVIPKDDKLSYIPLQFIAEYIKNLGYDGFVYLSTVGDGENLVMFNWKEKSKIINKEEVVITEIKICSEAKE